MKNETVTHARALGAARRPLRLLLALLLAPLCLRAQPPASIAVQTWPNDPMALQAATLPNGLTVYLSENHHLPSVFTMLCVKAGGKYDPADATGLAHYLEHMLFKGTSQLGTLNYQAEKPHLDRIAQLYEQLAQATTPKARQDILNQIDQEAQQAARYAVPNEFDRLMADMGGTQLNAFTYEDRTVYVNKIHPAGLTSWLRLSTDRFADPVFRLFQTELETVYEEKNRYLDDPQSVLFEAFRAQLMPHHPYGSQTLLGTVEHLKTPSIRRMETYYAQHYKADNMALILCGDFEADTLWPHILRTLGTLPTGAQPQAPVYQAPPAAGRQLVYVNLTPYSTCLAGFLLPPPGHPDHMVMQVIATLLKNDMYCGLLDELNFDNKVSYADAYIYSYDEAAFLALQFDPNKDQTVEEAEKLVMNKLKAVANGSFKTELLEAAKKETLKALAYTYEDNEERAYNLAKVFSRGYGWGHVLALPDSVAQYTKQRIQQVAKKYLTGGNYLLLVSSPDAGLPPAQFYLQKPNFTPIPALNRDSASAYYRTFFDAEPLVVPPPQPLDYQNAYQQRTLRPQFVVKAGANPYNNIFGLDIIFGAGRTQIPELYLLPDLLDEFGSPQYTPQKLRQAFYALGCDVSFDVQEERFKVSVNAFDDDLPAVLELLNQMIFHTKFYWSDWGNYINMRQSTEINNQYDRADPNHVLNALRDYILLGQKSPHLREYSLSSLSHVTDGQLQQALGQLRSYGLEVRYVGHRPLDTVAALVEALLDVPAKLQPAQPPVVHPQRLPTQPTVYIIDMPDAVQTQLYFLSPGQPMHPEDGPVYQLFNEYISGEDGGLVFQEIRELRSLAYDTYATYVPGRVPGAPGYLEAYVGCQADKTLEAIDVMTGILHNMPRHPARLPALRRQMQLSLSGLYPDFLNVMPHIDVMREWGYQQDPFPEYFRQYGQLTLDDIYQFYDTHVRQSPLSIAVVGNMQAFKASKLKKYGTVVPVTFGTLFAN